MQPLFYFELSTNCWSDNLPIGNFSPTSGADLLTQTILDTTTGGEKRSSKVLEIAEAAFEDGVKRPNDIRERELLETSAKNPPMTCNDTMNGLPIQYV